MGSQMYSMVNEDRRGLAEMENVEASSVCMLYVSTIREQLSDGNGKMEGCVPTLWNI